MKVKSFLAVITFFLLYFAVKPCFTVVVGREASQSGAVLLAHNEDERGDPPLKIWWVPSRRGLERFKLLNGAQETWRGNPEMLWIEMKLKYFSDFFLNSFGVAVVSNACASKVKGKRDGISYFLRRLAVERAASAREAVRRAGELIEKYGYPEGRTLTFVDPKEGWLMHILGGKHWLAWRVPDDAVALLPNNFTAGEVDLRDRENIMHSRGFLSFAVKKGYLKKGELKLHFSRIFSANYAKKYNAGRWLSAYKVLTGKDYTDAPPFPPYIRLPYKVGPRKIFEVLRQRPQGGLDLPSLLSIRSICYYTTKHSFVLSVEGTKPGKILLWFSPARPDASPYIPIFFAARKLFPVWKGSHSDILRRHFIIVPELRTEITQLLYYPFRTYADAHYLNPQDEMRKWKRLEDTFFHLVEQGKERVEELLKKGKRGEAEELLLNLTGGALEMAKAQLR